jgi:hypothetical protein
MGKNNNGRFETQSEADVDGPAYVGVDSSGIHRATNTPVASELIIGGGDSVGNMTHKLRIE